MTFPSNEADARIVIDDLLRVAGWDPSDKSRVRTEVFVRSSARASLVRETSPPYGSEPIDAVPDSSGRADYVLYSTSGRPLALIEAKKSGASPYAAKQQT